MRSNLEMRHTRKSAEASGLRACRSLALCLCASQPLPVPPATSQQPPRGGGTLPFPSLLAPARRGVGGSELPYLSRGPSLDPQNRFLDTQNRSLDLQNCSLDTQECSLDTQKCSPDTQKCSLDIQKCSPDTQNCSPDTQECSLDTQKCSPDTQKCPGHTGVLPGHTEVLPGHTSVLPGHTEVIPGHTELPPGYTELLYRHRYINDFSTRPPNHPAQQYSHRAT